MGRRTKMWIVAGSLLGLSTALIGAAHTPWGRPLLAWLPGGGCPLDGAAPDQVEAFRQAALAGQVGEREARSPAALAFTLGRSGRADVLAWLSHRGVSCESMRQGSVIRCRRQPLCAEEGELAIEDVHFQFDAAERLVAVDVMRRESSAEGAVNHLQALSQRLDRTVGPVTDRGGELDADRLEAQRFARASLDRRYRHYVAKLSALNLGERGVRVREQYQLLDPSSPDGRTARR